MATSIIPSPGIDAYHRERSRCMDAFAACEEAVHLLLVATGAKFGAEPFMQKVSILSKVSTSPQYSKAQKQSVDAILQRLAALLPLRADIVHSQARVVDLAGEAHACFINARQIAETGPLARLLKFADFRALTRDAAKIAEDLRGNIKVSPASSKPQPLPDEATAP